jgi:hypothetical protein
VPKRAQGPKPQDIYLRDLRPGGSPDAHGADASNLAIDGGERRLEFTREVTKNELLLLAHIAAALQKRFPEGAPGFTDEQLAQASGRMTFTYPTNWSIAEVGPCFETKSLAEWWKVTPERVRRRVANGTVFALKMKGRYLYPAFQLDAGGRVSRKFFELVALVRPTFSDDFEMAKWLAEWPTKPSPARLLSTGRTDEAFERANERLTGGPAESHSP